ncbi:hypothetical protein I0C86_27410 [Plantactinospora sp. S1510]|uniref:DUF3558 domain-containing protein n=1 Tax=Plantactinospora alkalitolerans TaxID=2789879 RepID=A0ABS0H3E2_9ACTN|nr:hypothetical protein [Plantactinospora alkalitolerans]MBF9132654.1 hypothetical protein [Plantactinospora alkalitolerans]
MMTSRSRLWVGLAAGVLLVGLAGCAGSKPAAPAELQDPCVLVTDEMLGRLAPGSKRESSFQKYGESSGSKQCAIDLNSETGPFSGDIAIKVEVTDFDSFDARWRADRCADVGAKPTSDGPGDHSCLVVRPWKDGEARVDGWAWVGDNYEVYVAYQLVEPQTFPTGAEQDMRDLLAAGVDSLPTD